MSTTQLVIVLVNAAVVSAIVSHLGLKLGRIWALKNEIKHKQFMDDMDSIENGTYEGTK